MQTAGFTSAFVIFSIPPKTSNLKVISLNCSNYVYLVLWTALSLLLRITCISKLPYRLHYCKHRHHEDMRENFLWEPGGIYNHICTPSLVMANFSRTKVSYSETIFQSQLISLPPHFPYFLLPQLQLGKVHDPDPV